MHEPVAHGQRVRRVRDDVIGERQQRFEAGAFTLHVQRDCDVGRHRMLCRGLPSVDAGRGSQGTVRTAVAASGGWQSK